MNINHKALNRNERVNLNKTKKFKETFTWNLNEFQVDPVSQGYITAKAVLVLKYEARSEVYPDITWRTAADTFYIFTPTEFLDFAEAVGDHVENIMVQSWNDKDKP